MSTAVSDVSIGVIMLDTAFPRPVGDIGNPASFDFPVIFERVPGASVERAVRQSARGLLEPFIAAGRRLTERGAVALVTSCGFLVLHQQALSDALQVPVASSSLLQLPWVEQLLGVTRRCGVITYDQTALGPAHLAAAGARADTPIAGMPADGELRRVIDNNEHQLDEGAVETELLMVAQGLIDRVPTIGAFVLECTNLPPYAATLREKFGLPVYDSLTMINWLWRACRKE